MIADKDDSEDESLFIDRPALVTNRLILRSPRESDIPALVRLADNRHVAQMLARMPHPYGEAEARAFIAMAEMKRPGVSYALTLAGTGTFVGCAGLNVKDRGLELGYWIGEPYWKRGFATEAAHALVDLAFRATDIPSCTPPSG
jgi:RimJ/RimL family protein N-acetyltransferase